MKSVFKTGMLYTAIGQYSNVLIQLLLNIVLSRLISVEEFGIVATVQVFMVFFQLIVTAGLGPAIIQNKSLSAYDYGVLFNYTVIFSILLSVVFGFMGIAIGYIYNNYIYIKLFLIMSVIIFSEGINVVPTAILNKELRFKALNLRLLLCNLLGAIFGIYTAFLGWGVYSIIISVAFPAVATLIANFLIVKISYNWKLDRRVLKSVQEFAGNQLGFTIVNYFSRNTDNLLIGKFIGPASLGYYQKSYQLITMPNTVLLGIISPVLQPILSKHQDDVQLIKKSFFKIFNVLAYIAFPISAYMFVNSQNIIFLLFGPNWDLAVMPLKVMSLSIWAQVLTSATGAIFMARNHSKKLFFTGIISTSIIFTLTVIGVLFGNIVFVSITVCLAYIINFFSSYWILMKYVLEGKLRDIIKITISPFILGIVCLIILYIANNIFLDNNFIHLLFSGIVMSLICFVYLFFTGELKKFNEL